MEIKIVKRTDDRLHFILEGADDIMANQLRKYIMSDIPVLAINKVTIYQNESLYLDAHVANMMTLIPIAADPDNYLFRKDCCEGGCHKCRALFEIDITCPKGKLLNVTNHTMRKISNNDAMVKRYKVLGQPAPFTIAKMSLAGRLHLQCEAELGIARSHAKWRHGPVVICLPEEGGNHLFKIESNGQLTMDKLLTKIREKLDKLKNKWR